MSNEERNRTCRFTDWIIQVPRVCTPLQVAIPTCFQYLDRSVVRCYHLNIMLKVSRSKSARPLCQMIVAKLLAIRSKLGLRILWQPGNGDRKDTSSNQVKPSFGYPKY